MWSAHQGSATVFINGRAAFRQNDPTQHCGGSGKLIEGSDNVIIGDSSGTGGGAGGRRNSQQHGGTTKATTAAPYLPSASLTRDAGEESNPVAASRPLDAVEPQLKTAWIEIHLHDEVGSPVAGEEYRIELPDGSIRRGRLDNDGKARLLAIASGTCVVTFPYLDAASWRKT
jgi:hypothetical protein